MAFRLTKKETSDHEAMAARIEIADVDFSKAIETYNAAIAQARQELQESQTEYNEVLQDAREFVQDIASSRRDEFDGRSERWQEGDKGTAASSFVEAWEGFDAEDAELEIADDLEAPEGEILEAFNNLPTEADEA